MERGARLDTPPRTPPLAACTAHAAAPFSVDLAVGGQHRAGRHANDLCDRIQAGERWPAPQELAVVCSSSADSTVSASIVVNTPTTCAWFTTTTQPHFRLAIS